MELNKLGLVLRTAESLSVFAFWNLAKLCFCPVKLSKIHEILIENDITAFLKQLIVKFRGYEVRIADFHPVGRGSNPHEGDQFFFSFFHLQFICNECYTK